MVLSIAFVLAFIGAAVSLLLGILIFSEVSDVLIIDSPEIHPAVVANGTWQYREMRTSSLNAACFWFFSPTQIHMQSKIGGSHCDGLLFKTFPRHFLENTDIIVDWDLNHDLSDTNDPQHGLHLSMSVKDGPNDGGEYRSINGTQFTSGVIGEGGPCGGGFPVTNCYTKDNDYPNLATWSFNVDKFQQILFGSPPRHFETLSVGNIPGNSPKATIFLGAHDHATSLDINNWLVYSVEIKDSATGQTKAFWDFSSGNTQNCQFGFPCQGVVPNEAGEFTVTSFGTQIIQNATMDTGNSDVMESAKDTAWTVIAILPVALFFALFALFSSFTNRQ